MVRAKPWSHLGCQGKHTFRRAHSSPCCGIPSADLPQTSSWSGQSLMGRGWTVWAGGWCCPYSWLPGCTSKAKGKIKDNQYRWVPEEGTITLHYLTASILGLGQSLKSNCILGKTKRIGWINSFSEVKHSMSAGIILALIIQKVKNTQLQHVCANSYVWTNQL